MWFCSVNDTQNSYSCWTRKFMFTKCVGRNSRNVRMRGVELLIQLSNARTNYAILLLLLLCWVYKLNRGPKSAEVYLPQDILF